MGQAVVGELFGSEDFGDAFEAGEELLSLLAVGGGCGGIGAVDEADAAFGDDVDAGFGDFAGGAGGEQLVLPKRTLGRRDLGTSVKP